MFKSVDHALNVAYLSLIKTPYKSPSIHSGSTGAFVSWEDVATEAGMVFSVLREQLNANDLAIIDAWKITPETQRLEEIKIRAILSVVSQLSNRVNIDNEYLFVVVAEYCGLMSEKTEDWWSKKLNKSTRTLRRIRNGTARKKGINGIIDNDVKRINYKLHSRFNELGWFSS